MPDEEDKLLLGLKAVVFRNGVPQSPSRGGKWSRDGYILAECPVCEVPASGECTCGIYATTSAVILDRYIILDRAFLSPIILVGACGETEVWSSGWRAQAAQAHYIVDYRSRSPAVHRSCGILALEIATSYFGLEVIPFEYALDLIEVSWSDCGYSRLPISQPRSMQDVRYLDRHNSMSFDRRK